MVTGEFAASRAALADRLEKETGADLHGETVELLVRRLLDAVDPVREAERAEWIAARQNGDGGFPREADGPSDLCATVFAYLALRVAGGDAEGRGLRRAAWFVVARGGVEALAPEPAQVLLAVAGVIGWDAAGGASGALGTAAGGAPGALAAAAGVLGVLRPVRELGFEVEELRVGGGGRMGGAVRRAAQGIRARAGRRPEAARVLLDGQESGGSWGGDRAHTAVCALALWALGHGVRHPAMRAALDALASPEAVVLPAGAVDAALVLRCLAAAQERAGADPAVDRALDRLLPRTALAPMAVSDVAGTAAVLSALHAVQAPHTRETDAVAAAGVHWLLERQAANGGWSRHGLHGSGAVDPTAPGVTAQAVEALCGEGYGWHPAVRRAVRLLLAEQAVEGCWNDRRDGPLRATTEVLLGLEAAGVRAGHLAAEGAMEWIYRQQNPDGGWSDGPAGTPSSAVQTARCVIAAYTTGVLDAPRLEAAAAFLLRPDADRPPSGSVRAEAYALRALALHARRTPAPSAEPVQAEPAAAEPAEYDSWSTYWWQRRGPLAILHWCASVRAEHIPPASRPGALLIDVACGGGLLHPHIADKGYRHLGIDVSAKSAEVARRHGVDEVLLHDIHDIPLPDGCADVVVAGYCLEHVERPFDVVAECCRLLRPGGTLVMDTIADTLLARFAVITAGEGLPVSWAAPKGSHDHRDFIAPARLAEECAANGVPVEVFGVVPVTRDILSWSLGRAYTVRMRSGKSTKILYGVAGVKPLR
ncbi:methyltransferase domain-containing protein [Kitasatospora sp. NPDC006697]|uniref:methyltransferase domain-containing protein n=1 Tax=Kitasatospora sp. NPDC006697 TaxID=3364020 RepID=UPI0036C0EB92